MSNKRHPYVHQRIFNWGDYNLRIRLLADIGRDGYFPIKYVLENEYREYQNKVFDTCYTRLFILTSLSNIKPLFRFYLEFYQRGVMPESKR